MTPEEKNKIHEALNLLMGRATDLMRHSMWEKAWDDVILELLTDRIAKESGEAKGVIVKRLNDRHKEKYQQRLEAIEKINPARAAQLDTRGPDDIIP